MLFELLSLKATYQHSLFTVISRVLKSSLTHSLGLMVYMPEDIWVRSSVDTSNSMRCISSQEAVGVFARLLAAGTGLPAQTPSLLWSWARDVGMEPKPL